MEYEEFLEASATLNARLDEIQAYYDSLPRGAMGLIVEEVRMSGEYKSANNKWCRLYKMLQTLNRANKVYCRRRANERRNARIQKISIEPISKM